MTKILVTGDRNWWCVSLAKKVVRRLLARYGDVTIIHGDCRGCDKSFDQACKAMDVPVEVHPADWTKGRGEGPARNKRMILQNPLFVIAFHKNIQSSRGTANCIRQALAHNLNVYLIDNEQCEAKRVTEEMFS